jgi:hypothetical protein
MNMYQTCSRVQQQAVEQAQRYIPALCSSLSSLFHHPSHNPQTLNHDVRLNESTLNPTSPQAQTLNPQPSTLFCKPQNPVLQTPQPCSANLNPQPCSANLKTRAHHDSRFDEAGNVPPAGHSNDAGKERNGSLLAHDTNSISPGTISRTNSAPTIAAYARQVCVKQCEL